MTMSCNYFNVSLQGLLAYFALSHFSRRPKVREFSKGWLKCLEDHCAELKGHQALWQEAADPIE